VEIAPSAFLIDQNRASATIDRCDEVLWLANQAMRLQLDIDIELIEPGSIPAVLAQLGAAQSALAARLMNGAAVSTQPVSTPADKVELLTVPEVAKRLKLAPGFVYELCRNGKLPAIRTGKYVRVAPAAVEEFIVRQGADLPQHLIHTCQTTTTNATLRSCPNKRVLPK
jgi:excisionase family DNA binding protein